MPRKKNIRPKTQVAAWISCKPKLDMLPDLPLIQILQYLDRKSKMRLRGVSKRLQRRVEELSDRLFYWNFNTVRFLKLRKFSNSVNIVHGLRVGDLVGSKNECDTALAHVAKKHPELSYLRIGNMRRVTNITDAGFLSLLTLLQNLKTLKISYARITGEIVSSVQAPQISKKQGFQVPQKQGVQISNKQGVQISKNQGVQILSLDSNTHITAKGLGNLLTLWAESLVELDLSSLKLNERPHFNGQLPNIERLDLSYYGQLDDSDVSWFIQHCGFSIGTLILSGLSVKGVNLNISVDRLRNLEILDLDGCRNISDSGLVVFLSKCPKLRILNLKQTGVSGEELSNEPSFTRPSLEFVDLSFCESLTDGGLKEIMTIFQRSLRLVKLHGVPQITAQCLDSIKRMHCRDGLQVELSAEA